MKRSKGYPSVPRQPKLQTEHSTSEGSVRAYHHEYTHHYGLPAYHSQQAVEGNSVRDSRDEVPFDKYREQQIQDHGMYKDYEEVPFDHFPYVSEYHFQHGARYTGYYYYNDMRALPHWNYGDQGYHAPPQYTAITHRSFEESHEQRRNHNPPEKQAHGTIAGSVASRTAPLFMACDVESLSEYQCLIRKQIELFSATTSDIELTVQGRNRHIEAGQVGVRCRHCADLPIKKRARGAVYYPSKLGCIYQAAQNMASVHLTKHCTRVPSYIRTELLKKDRKSSAGSGKEYWALGASTLGVVEADGRLWFGSNMVPFTSSQEFGHYGQQH